MSRLGDRQMSFIPAGVCTEFDVASRDRVIGG